MIDLAIIVLYRVCVETLIMEVLVRTDVPVFAVSNNEEWKICIMVPAMAVYYDGGISKETWESLEEHWEPYWVDPYSHTVFCKASEAVYAMQCTPNLWE